MADPGTFEDPEPAAAEPPSRTRRALTVAVLVALIVSIVFLAFVSGRGVVTITPDVSLAPTISPAPLIAPLAVEGSRVAVIDAAGHLMTTDAAGGSIIPYGDTGIVFSFPAWSPDGSRIAVLGQHDGDQAVYLFTTHQEEVAGADPAIVYHSKERPPFYLYWAPDGRRLTFLTTEPDGIALRLAPADASTPAAIVREGAPMYWAWVDQARLLVHSGAGGPAAFFGEIDEDGRSVEPAAIETAGFRAPAVSRDGRFRAFVAPGNGVLQQIVIEARDRSNPHTLDVFGTAALEFGPTGSELAFVAAADAARSAAFPVGPLRLMDATSGAVRTVLTGSVVTFFWSPDGRTIAALMVPAPGDDKVATRTDATLASAVSPRDGRSVWTAALTRAAATSGVALRLVFLNVASGAIRSQRQVLVSDTFTGGVLPYFDQYALSHRMWSADAASVVLPLVDDDGKDQLVVIQADGSGVRPIADGVAGFWSP